VPHSNNPVTRDIRNRKNQAPKFNEKTPPQVASATFGLTQPRLATLYPSGWFTKVREMRKDPTISLVRDLVLGPIVSSEWSVGHTKEAPEGSVEFITKTINNLRTYLVTNALTGWMDFGWQAFEKIWVVDDEGMVTVDKLKPLLQDITHILVDVKTGEYRGTIQQYSPYYPQELVQVNGWPVFGAGYLRAKDTILTNINVEGTYWYGRAIMENAVIPYDGWTTVNDSADRYDRKIAGSHWVVHYPLGEGTLNGVEVDNFIIAERLIQNLESSGAIAVPRQVDQVAMEIGADGVTPDAWKIELLSDQSSQQAAFIDRLKYYDALKVRALGFPERSVLEGKFGTKAEAEVHSDLAVVIADYRHQTLTEQISYQLINDLLRYNWGRESIGTVFLKAAPIADDIKIFLRQIFLTLMQHDPRTALKNINGDEIRAKLGLTKNDSSGPEDDDSEFDFPEITPESKDVPGRPGATNLNPVEGENTSK